MRIGGCHQIIIVGLIVLLASEKAASEKSFTGQASSALVWPPPTLWMLTTLAWQASPSPDVTGYAIYYYAADLALTNRLDVGKALSVTIPLLVGSTYSIHAVAYTGDGIESEPSNFLEYTPPPLTRLRLVALDGGGVQIRFRTSPLALCRVEQTDNLAAPTWQAWVTVRADFNGDVVLTDSTAGGVPARFYRAVKL